MGAGDLLIRAEVWRVKKGQQQGSRATGQWRKQMSGHLTARSGRNLESCHMGRRHVEE